MNHAGEILKRAAWLRSVLLDRIRLVDHNRAELRRLDADGRIYATPHYRAGRYLYLIHPTKDGERRRDYIGADPAKVADALRQVDNARNYDALEAEMLRIEGALYAATNQIEAAIRGLELVAPLDLATQGADLVRPLSPSVDDSRAHLAADAVTNGINSTVVTKPTLEQLNLSPL